MKKINILDGATGTMLPSIGLIPTDCVPLWILKNFKSFFQIQQNYLKNGAEILYSPTFGANRAKIPNVDIADLNKKLAEISKSTGGKVAGDVSPTGLMLEPYGDTTEDEMLSIFSEQIKGLALANVDYIVIETMMFVDEAIVAVKAAKLVCDIPIMLTMTFDHGRTLCGKTPDYVAKIFEELGVFAVGCNCGDGPESMLDNIKIMSTACSLPLIAKPNAGLPKFENGEAKYDLSPEEFAKQMLEFREYATFIGGCCGTTPEHIKSLKNLLNNTN